MRGINQYRVEALVTEPFRTQIVALITAVTLQDAVKQLNDVYPAALLTSVKEI